MVQCLLANVCSVIKAHTHLILDPAREATNEESYILHIDLTDTHVISRETSAHAHTHKWMYIYVYLHMETIFSPCHKS